MSEITSTDKMADLIYKCISSIRNNNDAVNILIPILEKWKEEIIDFWIEKSKECLHKVIEENK